MREDLLNNLIGDIMGVIIGNILIENMNSLMVLIGKNIGVKERGNVWIYIGSLIENIRVRFNWNLFEIKRERNREERED